MRILLAVLLIVGVVVQTSAYAADLYMCKQPNGVTAYQQEPCKKNEKTLKHTTYRLGPDAPTHSPNNVTAFQSRYRAPTPPNAADVPPNAGSRPAAHTTLVRQADSGCHGIGCSAYQRGDVHTTRCMRPHGRAYYTTGACKTRLQYIGTAHRDWQEDTVQGVPGAIMTGPDTAIYPDTGNVLELQDVLTNVPVYLRTHDHGTSINPRNACAKARLDVRMHPRDGGAAERARTVCNKGRGLWDQPPPDHGAH